MDSHALKNALQCIDEIKREIGYGFKAMAVSKKGVSEGATVRNYGGERRWIDACKDVEEERNRVRVEATAASKKWVSEDATMRHYRGERWWVMAERLESDNPLTREEVKALK